jgi:hypothetical protein
MGGTRNHYVKQNKPDSGFLSHAESKLKKKYMKAETGLFGKRKQINRMGGWRREGNRRGKHD